MYQLDMARSNENRKINRNLRKILSKSVFFFQDNRGAIAMVMAASIAKGIKVLLKNGAPTEIFPTPITSRTKGYRVPRNTVQAAVVISILLKRSAPSLDSASKVVLVVILGIFLE